MVRRALQFTTPEEQMATVAPGFITRMLEPIPGGNGRTELLGLEPGERTGHARPERGGAGRVINSLALVAESDVVGQPLRQSFVAGKKRDDVRIRLASILEQLLCVGRGSLATKCSQGLGVGKRSTGVFVVRGEERVKLVVPFEPEKPLSLTVAESLVVVWVQAEHLPVMPNRLLAPIEGPERLREGRSGTHVGARLEDPPEVANVLLERLGAERALAGGDALLEEPARLFGARCRLFSKQQVGVSAIGRDRERLTRERGAAWTAGVERLVHDGLCLEQRLVGGVVATPLPNEASTLSIERGSGSGAMGAAFVAGTRAPARFLFAIDQVLQAGQDGFEHEIATRGGSADHRASHWNHRMPTAANTTMYRPQASRTSESCVSQVDRLRTAAKSVMTAPTGDQCAIDSQVCPSVPL